jgi:hypothetical protein
MHPRLFLILQETQKLKSHTRHVSQHAYRPPRLEESSTSSQHQKHVYKATKSKKAKKKSSQKSFKSDFLSPPAGSSPRQSPSNSPMATPSNTPSPEPPSPTLPSGTSSNTCPHCSHLQVPEQCIWRLSLKQTKNINRLKESVLTCAPKDDCLQPKVCSLFLTNFNLKLTL